MAREFAPSAFEETQAVQIIPQTEVDSTRQDGLGYEIANKNGGETRPIATDDSERDRISAEAGSVFHAVVAHMDDAKSELHAWIGRHYAKSPHYQKSWAHRVALSLDDLRDLLPQSDNFTDVRILTETRAYVPQRARRATRFLASVLRSARMRGKDIGFQVESALRSSPYVNGSTEDKSRFFNKVTELPNGLTLDDDKNTTVTRDHIINWAHDARTIHAEHNGDLHLQHSARPDLIIIESNKQGENAEWVSAVAEKFSEVMRTGSAFDPDALAKMSYALPGSELEYSGSQIICEAIKLMFTKDIRLKLYDLKTLSHIGETYANTDEIWEANGGKLQAIFSSLNLMKTGAGLAKLNNILSKNILDVAKTYGTLKMLFAAASAENNMHVSITHLMGMIDYGILFGDFDIRNQKGRKGPGIPANISYAIIPIEFWQIAQRWNEWTHNLYRRQKLGEAAAMYAIERSRAQETDRDSDH